MTTTPDPQQPPTELDTASSVGAFLEELQAQTDARATSAVLDLPLPADDRLAAITRRLEANIPGTDWPSDVRWLLDQLTTTRDTLHRRSAALDRTAQELTAHRDRDARIAQHVTAAIEDADEPDATGACAECYVRFELDAGVVIGHYRWNRSHTSTYRCPGSRRPPAHIRPGDDALPPPAQDAAALDPQEQQP